MALSLGVLTSMLLGINSYSHSANGQLSGSEAGLCPVVELQNNLREF